MTDQIRARVMAALDLHCPADDLPEALGVAVSGGGDSLALLHLCVEWGVDRDVPVLAVTIDHGLRQGSADEAQFVAVVCAALGIEHTVLHWRGWDGAGNLQDAARQARRQLISDWALAEGIEAVALGHTQDDQAETVLMNVARGSGVDGLAGMTAAAEMDDLRWIRPLLIAGREELRGYLRGKGQTWIEDPSNDDDRFTRVKARKLLAALGELGLTASRLTDMADRMQDAREVLTLRAYELGGEVRADNGDVLLPLRTFRAAPRDTRHRTLAALLQAISGQEHRPRFRPLADLAASLAFQGEGGTLHGALVTVETASATDDSVDLLSRVRLAVDPKAKSASAGERVAMIRVTREHAAVAELSARPGEIWDNRWCLEASDTSLLVRALGKAAMGPLPETRSAALPRTSLMSSPALWQGETLIAAPLAGLPGPANLNVTCRNLLARRDPLATLRGV